VRTISYDALGQVASESYTSGPLAGLSLNRGTDTLLRKTSLTLKEGGATLWSQGFGYGDASRLASVTMGDDTVQYGYVTNSPLVGSMAFGHSGSTVMTTKQYDAVNRLTLTSSAVGSTVVSSHLNSTINALDQRKRTDLADGKNWRYEYNSRGELTRGVLYGTNNQAISGMDFRYTYDNSGNRLTRSQASSILTTYTSNLVNQYTTIAEGVTATPSYDADGNMTSSGSAYDDRILEYDGENRLTTVRRASDQAVVATYTYDDQGRRVRVQTTSAAPQGAGDLVNIWDGWNLVGELDYTSATGAHQPRRTYAWGLDLSGSEQGAGGIGGLVIQRDATSGDGYFPAYDPNGNLTTLVKSSDGTVGASYSYDPYGNLLSSTGTYASTNRVRFSTKYFCPEVGLYYYGYRFYNPVQGRWVNRDPIEEEGGVNLYGMVSNDPANKIDPFGLDFIAIGQRAPQEVPFAFHFSVEYWKSKCHFKEGEKFDRHKFQQEAMARGERPMPSQIAAFELSNDRDWIADTYQPGALYNPPSRTTDIWISVVSDSGSGNELIVVYDPENDIRVKAKWGVIDAAARSYAYAEYLGTGATLTTLRNWPNSIYQVLGNNSTTFAHSMIRAGGLSWPSSTGWSAGNNTPVPVIVPFTNPRRKSP
ncbi:MAG: hypothetical protein E6Q40_01355, partial [Cupriavidus sp.]